MPDYNYYKFAVRIETDEVKMLEQPGREIDDLLRRICNTSSNSFAWYDKVSQIATLKPATCWDTDASLLSRMFEDLELLLGRSVGSHNSVANCEDGNRRQFYWHNKPHLMERLPYMNSESFWHGASFVLKDPTLRRRAMRTTNNYQLTEPSEMREDKGAIIFDFISEKEFEVFLEKGKRYWEMSFPGTRYRTCGRDSSSSGVFVYTPYFTEGS